MNGRDLARDTYAGIDMRWLERGPDTSEHPRAEHRLMRMGQARAQSLVVPWYEGQRRVKSLVGTDVRVKRVA